MKFGIDVQTALTQIWTTNMAVTFALGLRAFCVATGLLLATARGAEPVSPLIGATRDQLLSRYGEPKSQIAAGNRVIYFYARERVVLRDNVVVEIEPIGGDARRAPDAPEATPAPGTTTPGTTAPANPPNDASSATRPAPSTAPAPGTRPAQPVAPAPTPAPPAGDSKVEIKLVRPPSTIDSRPASPEATQPTPPPAAATAPAAPRILPVETTASTPTQSAPSPAAKTPADSKSTVAPETRKAVEPSKTSKEEPKKAPAPKSEPPPAEEPGRTFGTQTYVVVLAVFVGGVALLYWRHRQRQFMLAATSVSNTPLPSPVSASMSPFVSNAFTLDELNKLDAKKFEALVAAYYSKTGVVAERTKAGPESPVHIKIAWKGEPRPFAYVQCLAQPGLTIDPKPLQALVAAIEKDNIRRGYVVTSGKFNAIARDFAEQKHLTLLPADVFLEKLNALPSAARTEIIQSITNGGKAPA